MVPFLRTRWTHCEVCRQEKSSFFSTQPASLLSSPFCSVACLWLPESMELPSYILKGLLRNPPVCSFFIQSTLLSLFKSECQSLPLFPPSLPLSVLLHSTIQFLFFPTLSHLPTLLPPSHTTLLRFFSLPNFFFGVFFSFCFVDSNCCVHASKPRIP